MAEYIDKEAVLNCIDKDGRDGEYDLGYGPHNREFQELIKALPAADVRPVVRGKWEKRMEEKETPCYKSFTPIWFCSECGTEYDPSFCMTINFCPNCGADMKGENDG